MTKEDYERLEKWMKDVSSCYAGTVPAELSGIRSVLHRTKYMTLEIIPKLLAELRDHEEWKARIAQDHDAYDQGVKDRTTKFVEVLTALAEDQNKRMVYARHNPTAARAYEQGRDFCGVLLKMIEEGLL